MIAHVFDKVQPETYKFNNQNDLKTFLVHYVCLPTHSDVVLRLILSLEGQFFANLSS